MAVTSPAGVTADAPSDDSPGSPVGPEHARTPPTQPLVPLINFSILFRLGVDLLEAFENADPNHATRRQSHGETRLDEVLDAFLSALNPTRLHLTNDLPRDGWLELIDRTGLDRDARSVAKALAFVVADVNGGMDRYPRWWNRRLTGEIELEEFLAWADIRCRLRLALAGVWAVMSGDERKRVPAAVANRLLVAAGWPEIPVARPRPIRGFGGRVMGDRWRTIRLPTNGASLCECESITPTVLSGSGVTPTPPPPPDPESEYAALSKLVGELRMKKNGAKIVERVVEGNGSVKLADLATEFEWRNPDDGYNSAQ